MTGLLPAAEIALQWALTALVVVGTGLLLVRWAIMTARRCEAQTRKGSRCKSKYVVYHPHQDGFEYLACLRHHNEHFRPAAGIDQKTAG